MPKISNTLQVSSELRKIQSYIDGTENLSSNLLAQELRKLAYKLSASEDNYGGSGEFNLPKDHKPLEKVPEGGSCCANCRFVNSSKHTCGEPNYITWNGSPKLPDLPLNEMCSDWYQK